MLKKFIQISFIIILTIINNINSANACICTCIGNGSDRLKIGNVDNAKACTQSCSKNGYRSSHCH